MKKRGIESFLKAGMGTKRGGQYDKKRWLPGLFWRGWD